MSKGASYERELLGLYEADGWKVIRATGSGSGTDGDRPDILVGHPTRGRFAFEAKFRDSDSHLYVTKDEANALGDWATAFDATPLIAVRWKGKTAWEYYPPHKLPETEKSLKVPARNSRDEPNAIPAALGGLSYIDVKNYHTRAIDHE